MKAGLTLDYLDAALQLWLENLATYDIAKRLNVEEAAVYNEIFYPDARPKDGLENVVAFPRRAS